MRAKVQSCTHKEYLLSPEFVDPRYEKKHVTFSTTLPLPNKASIFHIFDCSEREKEVSAVFDCMKYLYPAPTGWSANQCIMDYTAQKVLKNWFYSDFCVDKGRAVITYTRPDRQPDDYKHILDDICDGYIIVHAYKELSRKDEYSNQAIPFNDMQKHYNNDCASGKNVGKRKPAFCFVEYKVEKEDTWYKKDCAENVLYSKLPNNKEYSVIKYNHAWQFAEFAVLSYHDNISNSFQNNWSYLQKHYNDHSGFFAHAFINHDFKIISIVFRGTDDKSSDWVFSNSCFYIGCIPMQYKDALEFYDTVHNVHGDNYQYIVSGHSLGGGLAQLLSIEKSIEAIVFDSPGVLNPARTIFSHDKIQSAINKITSYISGVNLVNSCCPNIVDPIQVQDQIIDDCDKLFAADYTFSQHQMDMILKKFDKVTGKPLNSFVIDKNDLSLRNSYDRFISQCEHEKHVCQIQMYREVRHIKPLKNKLTIYDTKLVVEVYLPAPKNDAKSNVCRSFSKISDKANDDYRDYIKIRTIDQVKHDIPCSLLQNKWQVDTSQQFIDIYSNIMTCDLGEDREFYSGKIMGSDLPNRYEISINNEINTESPLTHHNDL